jgi:pimeloyl-ACP methyl ester carboxylesterase
VCEAVAQEIEQPAKVFVVSPALTGRLRSLASDIDGAVAAAEQRLKAVLCELRSAGLAARGSVGDEDPLLAIEDTLREFTPTEILIVTSDSSHENWRERHIRQRVAALGLPVRFVQAPLKSQSTTQRRENTMATVAAKAPPTITTTDGTVIYYKDWGSGQPVVFSHGWPLNADAWDEQLNLIAANGFRAIAHDRRGHGRSSQPWDGNDMDTYADDLAELIEELDLRDIILIGHSTGGGEVTRYIGRHGTVRVAKAVLVSAIPPLMLKTYWNPGGLPIKVFDEIRDGIARDRSQFYEDLSFAFYGANRGGSTVSQGRPRRVLDDVDAGWLQGRLRLRQGLLRDGPHRRPQALRHSDVDHPRRRRSNRPVRGLSGAVVEARTGRGAEGLCRRTARADDHAPRQLPRRPPRVHQALKDQP